MNKISKNMKKPIVLENEKNLGKILKITLTELYWTFYLNFHTDTKMRGYDTYVSPETRTGHTTLSLTTCSCTRFFQTENLSILCTLKTNGSTVQQTVYIHSKHTHVRTHVRGPCESTLTNTQFLCIQRGADDRRRETGVKRHQVKTKFRT